LLYLFNKNTFENASKYLPIDGNLRARKAFQTAYRLMADSWNSIQIASYGSTTAFDSLIFSSSFAATVRRLFLRFFEIFPPTTTRFLDPLLPFTPFVIQVRQGLPGGHLLRLFLVGFRRHNNATTLRADQLYRRWGRIRGFWVWSPEGNTDREAGA
jgi:hypothetical protein